MVIVLFAAAAVWGTVYWKRSFQAGRQPQFYQAYFEPAVMFACGRGFLLAHPTVPAVEAFIEQRSDRLSCDEIPATTKLSDYGLYQRTWLYLELTVGVAWKVLGVSWSGMGPLFGLLFGLTIVTAYAMFRIGMNIAVSAGGAVALAVSTAHLQNLPHLRDYAKAPFTLALIGLLFAMVTGPATWRRLLTIAGIYGLILGIGYGFRTDFLAEIPVFFVVLFVFLRGAWVRTLPMKVAAASLCVAVFAAAAWPVITAVRRGGGCQWHAALLGLTDPFNDSLTIEPAPYSYGHAYSDSLVYAITTAFARRLDPGVQHIEYCSPDYDRATGRYLATLAMAFPADMAIRTLASIERILGLPLRWVDPPLEGFARTLYSVRRAVMRPLRGSGAMFAGIALVALMAADIRLGFFALFVVAYFGGYPMLQFGVRHYFHLEVLTWWGIGFLIQQSFNRVRTGAWPALQCRRAAVVCGVLAIATLVSLVTVRAVQQRRARTMFEQYIDAPSTAIASKGAAADKTIRVPVQHSPAADPYPADVVAIDADVARCGPHSSVTFVYSEPEPEFTHMVPVGGDARAGVVKLFEPVYRRFEGVRLSGGAAQCVTRIAMLSAPERIPVLLSVTLQPGWQDEPLYERRQGWRWLRR